MRNFLLFVSIVLLSFVGCSDSDNEDIVKQPSRRLVKMECFDNEGNQVRRMTFDYDHKGRWIGSTNQDDRGSYFFYINGSTVVNYYGNEIEVVRPYGRETITDIYIVDNNIITAKKESYKSSKYEYEDGYLIRVGEDYKLNEYEYTNGNLTKVSEMDDAYVYNVKYTDIPDKMGVNMFDILNPSIIVSVTPENPFYQLGYLGKRSKCLIHSVSDKYDNNPITYSYILDQEGYVQEMVEESQQSIGSYVYGYLKYKFYYEDFKIE